AGYSSLNRGRMNVISALRPHRRFGGLVLAAALAVAIGTAVVRAQALPQPAPIIPKPLLAQTTPVRECASLKDVALPDTTIESAPIDPGNATVPASCRITAVTTHPPAGDRVRIWIALPMKDWNG